MKLLINVIIAFVNKFILKKSNGYTIKIFCENMGLAYIKLAQILAMQNIGDLFTEEDREDITGICDDCNRINYKHIQRILIQEYGKNYRKIFKKIQKKPIGSASISQVHRATLFNGDSVVIKVKRKDIETTVNKDIKTIAFLFRSFSWIFGVRNNIGINTALKYYEQWLREELDFHNEVSNIKLYSDFANSVNGKVKGCKNIVIPKVYKKLCTDNIIVMEYIPYQTIYRSKDRDKIITGINSYIKLSFYALFKNRKVVWHGDPHAGNIYITDTGDIGFLDMGLVFELSKEDAINTRRLFLNAYFGNYIELYNELVTHLVGSEQQKIQFKQDIKNYCNNIKNRPITSFFMDMVVVCFKYNISPPSFLYGMAKAFACLGGLDTIYNNNVSGHELVHKQLDEWIIESIKSEIHKGVDDCISITKSIMVGDTPEISKLIQKGFNIYTSIVERIT